MTERKIGKENFKKLIDNNCNFIDIVNKLEKQKR